MARKKKKKEEEKAAVQEAESLLDTDLQNSNSASPPISVPEPAWRANKQYRGLRPYPPGTSGNPKGRPKGKLPSEEMREMAEAMYGAEWIKKIQPDMPEPWRSMKNLPIKWGIYWIGLRTAASVRGVKDRENYFDRTEGRPTLRISGVEGGPPIEVLSLKNLSADDLLTLRGIMERANGNGKHDSESD